jgi:hypothetical protein
LKSIQFHLESHGPRVLPGACQLELSGGLEDVEGATILGRDLSRGVEDLEAVVAEARLPVEFVVDEVAHAANFVGHTLIVQLLGPLVIGLSEFISISFSGDVVIGCIEAAFSEDARSLTLSGCLAEGVFITGRRGGGAGGGAGLSKVALGHGAHVAIKDKSG